MSEENERLAIIKDVGIGLRDVGHPVLWFTTYVSEHTACLRVFSWAEAASLIKSAGVHDVKDLEGTPCWVTGGKLGQRTEFVRVWKGEPISDAKGDAVGEAVEVAEELLDAYEESERGLIDCRGVDEEHEELDRKLDKYRELVRGCKLYLAERAGNEDNEA